MGGYRKKLFNWHRDGETNYGNFIWLSKERNLQKQFQPIVKKSCQKHYPYKILKFISVFKYELTNLNSKKEGKRANLKMRAYHGVRNVRFLENLTCFVLLKQPFWDSLCCLITDEFKKRRLSNKSSNHCKIK